MQGLLTSEGDTKTSIMDLPTGRVSVSSLDPAVEDEQVVDFFRKSEETQFCVSKEELIFEFGGERVKSRPYVSLKNVKASSKVCRMESSLNPMISLK